MKFRSHTMWMILTAMFVAAGMAIGRQRTYSFSAPPQIETQLEKDIGMGMNYAVSLPFLKLPCSFYSYDTKHDFVVCLKTLRIKSTDFIHSFPADIIYNIISINGP